MSDRLFIFLDEWLWIGLCLYLLHRWATAAADGTKGFDAEARLWRRAFLAVLIVGAVMVYGISYPMLWGWIRP